MNRTRFRRACDSYNPAFQGWVGSKNYDPLISVETGGGDPFPCPLGHKCAILQKPRVKFCHHHLCLMTTVTQMNMTSPVSQEEKLTEIPVGKTQF